jgi:hypothetical protein
VQRASLIPKAWSRHYFDRRSQNPSIMYILPLTVSARGRRNLSALFFPNCNRPPVVFFIARVTHCPPSFSDISFELAGLVQMIVPIVNFIFLLTVLTFHDPGDHHILFVPGIPASPACALFQCPHKDEDFTSGDALTGWSDFPQESFDGLHSSFSSGQVMDNGNRNCEIEG